MSTRAQQKHYAHAPIDLLAAHATLPVHVVRSFMTPAVVAIAEHQPRTVANDEYISTRAHRAQFRCLVPEPAGAATLRILTLFARVGQSKSDYAEPVGVGAFDDPRECSYSELAADTVLASLLQLFGQLPDTSEGTHGKV